MAIKKSATKPKALLCGMLETGAKVLFLTRKEKGGEEAIEMPCCTGSTETDPMSQLAESFRKQTGIKAHPVHVVMEGKHNAGTAKKPEYVPVIVYEMMPDEPLVVPEPGKGFSGFVKLTILAAKGKKLTEMGAWLREETEMVDD